MATSSTPGEHDVSQGITGKRPRQDSNLRTRLRRPALYPLSYGGDATSVPSAREG
jgi:hypothetical protein